MFFEIFSSLSRKVPFGAVMLKKKAVYIIPENVLFSVFQLNVHHHY